MLSRKKTNIDDNGLLSSQVSRLNVKYMSMVFSGPHTNNQFRDKGFAAGLNLRLTFVYPTPPLAISGYGPDRGYFSGKYTFFFSFFSFLFCCKSYIFLCKSAFFCKFYTFSVNFRPIPVKFTLNQEILFNIACQYTCAMKLKELPFHLLMVVGNFS